MYVLILEKGYDDYEHNIEKVYLHTKKQNAEELYKQFQYLQKIHNDSTKAWLKYNKLKNTKANYEKFFESPEYKMVFSNYPKTFEEFLLINGFMKISNFENIIE